MSGCYVFDVKIRPAVPNCWAWQRVRRALPEPFRASRHEENPDGRVGYTLEKLEFDSISPPRPESNYASTFQIRARGLEFDVDQRCFAQEQLTGPDPSGVPGSLINHPYD